MQSFKDFMRAFFVTIIAFNLIYGVKYCLDGAIALVLINVFIIFASSYMIFSISGQKE